MNKQCTGCVVSAGTHKPAEALHQQIDEPQAEAMRLADEFEESATHWVHEIDTRFKAAKMLRAQHARIAELEDDLQFVERWAVHHGSKPSISAEEALSCIQHYPAIHEITKSYKDGKRPDTFNPYARIAELEDKVQRAAEAERAAILLRVKNRACAGALLVKDFQEIVNDLGQNTIAAAQPAAQGGA